ncbi:WG repeat-containing protein [Hymenobacter sp. NST-14]|uniref:WG repeat-containing protein n=1 Tax=Hymenobacter piscis TaxID=2839984 RepID=UPI001C012BCD|nr:WG repeat-containing protein [Hymenobacter piscis]MBT9393150.1 WG repeat-containing protein [Hymenobacter piscis]
MLHQYQSAPFSSPVRQQQFDAVAAALRAEAGASATLLLGQVPLADGQVLDGLILRPRSLTIVQLLPLGGQLHIPDLRTGPWYLAGAPLELPDDAPNPFARFEQQRAALAARLHHLLPAEAANLHFITGLVLFGAPVSFGPEVEARMAAVPAASTFHLLPDPARFTRRLAQLATPEIDLTPADLDQVAAALGATPTTAPPAAAAAPSPQVASAVLPEPATTSELLRQKAGQLWRWLGAEDLDELDRTSTGYEIDLDARNQEKQALEDLRLRLQADMQQQLQALETREEEREARMAQLQQQLRAAPVAPEAPDLQAQLAAEKREKQALESAMAGYRTELESRNQELGQKIQQLEQLITRLATTSPTSTVSSTLPAAPPARAAAEPTQAAGPLPARPAQARRANPGALPGQAARWLPLAGRWLRRRNLPASWGQVLAGRPRYAVAAGGAALLLVLGIARCSSSDVPVAFRQNGRQGLLTADGDTLLPAHYTSIGEFRAGRAVVEQDGVFGFVGADGQELLAPAYDALYPYADGYARARAGGLYTFVNEEAEEFSTFYYAARDFSEGYAAVLNSQGWHYIQGPEESPEPVVFQEAYRFEQELARVKTRGAFTFISPAYLADTTVGTAPFGRYASATDFDADGRARVRQSGRTFYINREGEEVQD